MQQRMRLGILAADTWIRTLSAHVCKTHVQNTFGAKDSYCRAHSKYTSIVTCCRQHSFAKVYAHFSSDALPISNIMKLNFLHTRMLRNSHPNQCNWFLLDSEEKVAVDNVHTHVLAMYFSMSVRFPRKGINVRFPREGSSAFIILIYQSSSLSFIN